VIIERIDSDGKSSFYYLKNEKKESKIWAEYSGINDGFAGYLIFGKNGKVELLCGDGYFQNEDPNQNLFFFKRLSGASELPSDRPNVCQIWYPLETEKSMNMKSKSKVSIKYCSK
jgi:hypothetical protein